MHSSKKFGLEERTRTSNPRHPKPVRYHLRHSQKLCITYICQKVNNVNIYFLDAPLGLEPRLTDSKSALLPLEEGAVEWIPEMDSNHRCLSQSQMSYH